MTDRFTPTPEAQLGAVVFSSESDAETEPVTGTGRPRG